MRFDKRCAYAVDVLMHVVDDIKVIFKCREPSFYVSDICMNFFQFDCFWNFSLGKASSFTRDKTWSTLSGPGFVSTSPARTSKCVIQNKTANVLLASTSDTSPMTAAIQLAVSASVCRA